MALFKISVFSALHVISFSWSLIFGWNRILDTVTVSPFSSREN
jgi:hypothetical protein